ncbi:MAG: autotransporter domain-containing protein [Deltaproteobacteria bacterium]|nr:autotransporter domain-containing protein [Deltaproteobacteria bacterium]
MTVFIATYEKSAWADDFDNVAFTKPDGSNPRAANSTTDNYTSAAFSNKDPLTNGTLDGTIIRIETGLPTSGNIVTVSGDIISHSIAGGAGLTGTISGNTVNVAAAATVAGHVVGGANYATSGSNMNAQDNTVNIQGTGRYMVTGGLSSYGGTLSGNVINITGAGSITNTANSTIVQAAWSFAGVPGTFTAVQSTLSENKVIINSTGTFDFITGGMLENAASGSVIEKNTITVTGATIIRDTSGAFLRAGTGSVSNNTVTLTSVKYVTTYGARIFGAYNTGGGELIENKISINGGTYTGVVGIYGGFGGTSNTLTVKADGNIVEVRNIDITLTNAIVGGRTENAETINNTVTLENTKLTATTPTNAVLYGGLSGSGGVGANANSNIVKLINSEVTGHVYGGFTEGSSATTNLNQVELTGTLITGNLFGGNISTAVDNQVILRGGRNEITGTTTVGGKLTVMGGTNVFGGLVTATKLTTPATETVGALFSGGETELKDGLTVTAGDVLIENKGRVVWSGGAVNLTSGDLNINTLGTLAVSNTASLTLTLNSANKLSVAKEARLDLRSVNLTIAAGELNFAAGAELYFGETSGTRGQLNINNAASLVANPTDKVKLIFEGNWDSASPIDLIINAGAQTLSVDNFESAFYSLATANSDLTLQVVAAKTPRQVLETIGKAKNFPIHDNYVRGMALINNIRANPSTLVLGNALTAVINHIYVDLEGKQAEDLLKQLIGENVLANQLVVLDTLARLQGVVYGRLDRIREYNSLVPPGAGAGTELNRIWVGGLGMWTTEDNTGSYYGYDYSATGLALGYDKAFFQVPGLRLGFSVAFSWGDLENGDGLTDSDIDTVGIGLYGSYTFQNGLFIDGQGAYFKSENTYTSVLADGSGYEEGSFDIKATQFGVKVGLVTQTGNIQLIPSIGVRYVIIEQDGFTETQHSRNIWNVPNRFQKEREHQLDIPVNIKINTEVETSFGSVIPEMRLGWTYAAKRPETAVNVGYAINTGTARIYGIKTSRHSFQGGLGIKVKSQNRVDVFVNWDVDVGKNFVNHQASVGIGFEF